MFRWMLTELFSFLFFSFLFFSFLFFSFLFFFCSVPVMVCSDLLWSVRICSDLFFFFHWFRRLLRLRRWAFCLVERKPTSESPSVDLVKEQKLSGLHHLRRRRHFPSGSLVKQAQFGLTTVHCCLRRVESTAHWGWRVRFVIWGCLASGQGCREPIDSDPVHHGWSQGRAESTGVDTNSSAVETRILFFQLSSVLVSSWALSIFNNLIDWTCTIKKSIWMIGLFLCLPIKEVQEQALSRLFLLSELSLLSFLGFLISTSFSSTFKLLLFVFALLGPENAPAELGELSWRWRSSSAL